MGNQQLTNDDITNVCQVISFVVIKADIQKKEWQSRTFDKWWYNIEGGGSTWVLMTFEQYIQWMMW